MNSLLGKIVLVNLGLTLAGMGGAGLASARAADRLDAALAAPAALDADDTCDGSLTSRSEWMLPQRWGTSKLSRIEPGASPCGGNRTSRTLRATPIARDAQRDIMVSAMEERVRRSGSVRSAEVSFLIPAGSAATFNHVAAFAAFDDRDPGFRRLGAAVFRDRLYVELEDRGCRAWANLFRGVPVPDGLTAERWYRLYAQVEPAADGGVLISASVADLETLEMVAETSFTVWCDLAWYEEAKTGFGFLAERPRGSRNVPEVLVDDYAATASFAAR